MALTFTKVPDITYYLGESGIIHAYDLQPAAADYPTGGYPVTASSLTLGRLIGGYILGTTATGATYLAQFVEPAGAFSTTTPSVGVSLNLKVSYSSAAGAAFTEVPAATDLSAVTWRVAFLGW